jgi:AhpD family alkylhydroperoxidase
MIDFTLHTVDSAPKDSQPQLLDAQQELGMIPSLLGVLSESPQALEAYRALAKLFSQSSLSILERHVVWLTVSSFHQCHYCVPAHSMMGYWMGWIKKPWNPSETINH